MEKEFVKPAKDSYTGKEDRLQALIQESLKHRHSRKNDQDVLDIKTTTELLKYILY